MYASVTEGTLELSLVIPEQTVTCGKSRGVLVVSVRGTHARTTVPYQCISTELRSYNIQFIHIRSQGLAHASPVERSEVCP